MTDAPEKQTPSRRGEAAWKAEKERVADRNAQARKAGREEREAYERQKADSRRTREARQMADLVAKQR
jgi:hypothetical protein